METDNRICPQCGCKESFLSNCGFLSKDFRWCSRCGYLIEDIDELKDAVNKSLNIPVFSEFNQVIAKIEGEE